MLRRLKMSAYIVSNRHIQAILSCANKGERGLYYYWKRESIYFSGNLDKIGQILLDENQRSVNYRYDTNEPAPVFKWVPDPKVYTPVEIIKLVNCLDYQSCETDNWEITEAHTILEAIKERAIHLLPGYDEAEWSIS
jgi:hypothetical protein